MTQRILCRFSPKEVTISAAQTTSDLGPPSTAISSTSIAHTIPGPRPIGPEDDEETLINQYNVDGAAADEILGYDDDEDEEYNGDMEGNDDTEGKCPEDSAAFQAFQRQVRVAETRRAEGNRRAGGIKTQRAMVKAWEVC
jgi:hypothetical protein